VEQDVCAVNVKGGWVLCSSACSSAVQKMRDCWPLGVALWGEASSRHMLRWLKTVVVSDVEKAH
jgi:hypothetical protein